MHTAALLRRLRERLDREPDLPAAEALVEEVWLAVVEGELATGERLPTVRKLSVELGVGPRTVERAFQRLQRLGVAAVRPGEGMFVSLTPPPEAERERHRRFHEVCRQAVDAAEALGFELDDLLDALAEFRTRGGEDHL